MVDISKSAHQRIEFQAVLIDEKSLAARWSISVRTLQNRRVSGSGICFVKIGRNVRYRLTDIELIETNGLRASTSDGGQHDA